VILYLPLGKQPTIFHIERGVLDVFPRPDKIINVGGFSIFSLEFQFCSLFNKLD
jgi:hypothetical protein